jgi:DNA-directed RNA polymerase specialized sigma24 family protein
MVVVLRHFHDRSYREIATILQIPVSAVEHRLRAARQILQKSLAEETIASDWLSTSGGDR